MIRRLALTADGRCTILSSGGFRMPLQRVVWISLLLFSCLAVAGINWKSVCLEPRTPVVLTVGEAKPYTVIGRDGADVKADLTKSPYLNITSSDAEILEVN